MDKVNEVYRYLLKKERKANRIFITLNVLAIGLAAALIIMNLFAIRFNPIRLSSSTVQDHTIIWLFIGISILTGIASALSSMTSVFIFRKRATGYKTKKEEIKEEMKKHKDRENVYKGKDRDKVLVKRVLKIINE